MSRRTKLTQAVTLRSRDAVMGAKSTLTNIATNVHFAMIGAECLTGEGKR